MQSGGRVQSCFTPAPTAHCLRMAGGRILLKQDFIHLKARKLGLQSRPREQVEGLNPQRA